jgi:hypothetical protein
MRHRRIVRTTLIVVAVALSVIAAAPAVADEGLDIESETTYTPEPDRAVVEVASTYTLTNVQPTEYFDTYYSEYYFESFGFVVPTEARAIAAVAEGTTLNVRTETIDGEERVQLAIVDLPRRLLYQQTVVVETSFTILGGGARDDAFVRVNPAYLAFPIWACCDEGRTTIQVRVPSSFELDIQGNDPFARTRDGDDVILVADDELGDPREFFAMFIGRNDDGLAERVVEHDGRTTVIRSWPDDPEWASYVERNVTESLTDLETAVGVPYPAADDLEIIETISPYLLGYAGWFNTDTSVIEIGDELDDHVMLHELSHAWFNDKLFTERWINEGLAEEFSAQIVEASGDELDQPEEPEGRDDAFALHYWPEPRPNEDDTAGNEAYGYNASWFVMDAIADEIGAEGLSKVIVAATNDEISFLGEGEAEQRQERDDWRRFLDLVELRGGSTEAAALFREYVLSPEQVDLLTARQEAHDRYETFVTESGEWAAPLFIRTLLDQWRFTGIEDGLARAGETHALGEQAAAGADELGLTVPDDVELAYEGVKLASGFDEVDVMAQAQIDTLDVVAQSEAAVAAPRGRWTSWGLRGTDLDAMVAAQRSAFEANDFDAVLAQSDAIATALADAPGKAKRQAAIAGGIAAGALVLLVLAVWLLRRRRRHAASPDDPGSASTVAAAPADDEPPLAERIDDELVAAAHPVGSPYDRPEPGGDGWDNSTDT